MGRTNDLYMMMRLSYEQATDDYNNKKTDSIVNAYSKYYKENVGMTCYDPQGDIINFYDEDNSQECSLWLSFYFGFF